jgi:hypothetical protein
MARELHLVSVCQSPVNKQSLLVKQVASVPSLFNKKTQVTKWSLIAAVVALIIRIAFNDRFYDKDFNQIYPSV